MMLFQGSAQPRKQFASLIVLTRFKGCKGLFHALQDGLATLATPFLRETVTNRCGGRWDNRRTPVIFLDRRRQINILTRALERAQRPGFFVGFVCQDRPRKLPKGLLVQTIGQVVR